jgi:hypothetical protein
VKKGKVTYSYSATNPAYRITDARSSVAKFEGPALVTDVGWLDAELANTHTYASLAANVNIAAPMRLDQTPEVFVLGLAADFVLGDKTALRHTFPLKKLNVDAALDPLTLQPDHFKVALKDPAGFSGETMRNPLLNIYAVVLIAPELSPPVTITAELPLRMRGALNVFGAGLEMQRVNDQLEWVPDGTFIDLNALTTRSVTRTGSAVVAGGWDGNYMASLTVDATLAIHGKTTLGGLISAPQLASRGLVGTLEGSYFYSLDGTVKGTGDEFHLKNVPAGTFGPVMLFEI